MRLVFLLLLLIASASFGQDSLRSSPSDSVNVRSEDGIKRIKSYAGNYDPRKAMLLSAVIPGAGQAYNKKYWKMPLVYGGFAGIGYAVWWNQDRYKFYRAGLFNLLNEPDVVVYDKETGLTPLGNKVVNNKLYMPVGTSGYLSEDIVRNAVNKFRRDRDFALIMTFMFYMLQMVDAHVDAHLKEFDVNPELKVSLEPTIQQNYFTGRTTGVGITLKF